METAIETSAPTPNQPVGNVSDSEQAFLDSTRSPSSKQQAPAPTTEQVIPPTENTEQLPGEQPSELPPTVEYKIKDIHGNEKTVSPEWMAKYFQAVGQESLIPLINDEKNAPLLLHIAERTLKLNQAYADASKVRPQFEQYQSEVESYFDGIRKDPVSGIQKMWADMGIQEADQDLLVEKMALDLLAKREMSPEQRAAQAALKEQDAARAEADRYRAEVEELKLQAEVQQRQPVYQTGIASALQAEGLEVNDSTWGAMIQICKQQFGAQKEPISQAQFQMVAKQVAQIAMSFKKANAQAAAPATPTRTVSKGFQGKAPAQPVNKGTMTEEEWLAGQGMKKY